MFYIDRESGLVVKRIELADVIQDKEKSKCRFLNYKDGIIYIVDLVSSKPIGGSFDKRSDIMAWFRDLVYLEATKILQQG